MTTELKPKGKKRTDPLRMDVKRVWRGDMKRSAVLDTVGG
jgi:hypothetical protein